MQQPRESLHGFAEAHVVGEHAAKTLRGEMGEKLEALQLIRAQRGAQALGQRRGRQGGDLRGAVLQHVREHRVARGQRLGLERELQGVQAMTRGATALDHVAHAEAEAVERGGRGGVERDVGVHPAPAVAGEVHPLAAGLEQERDLVGAERGVLDLEADGEVKPVLVRVGRLGDGNIHVRVQRRAEQGGELGRELDIERLGERRVPGQKFVGEGLRDRARPGLGPAVPREAKTAQPRARVARRREVELQHRRARDVGRRRAVFFPDPTAEAGPELGAGRIVGAGGELGVEVPLLAVERGREPALEARLQRDHAHFGGEAGGQAQAGGAQARQQARIAERGDGQAIRRHVRRAAPDAAIKKVERLGQARHLRGGLGDAAIRRD